MRSPIQGQFEKKGLRSVDVVDYPALVEELAAKQKLPEKKVRAVMRDLVALIADGLGKGKAVRIGGLGVLRVRELKGAAAAGASTPTKRVVLSSAKKLKIALDIEKRD